ncbi:XRE family transcriptional regulator [Penaeicola halotolerans]|uniref:XRE family transcriptional regulator n=1 Tax=Penaeicola halotolerans TaxID=2793196 RepID=UPI001CF92B21|nr:helix-turn-helix domain-containing protein [Penaeicola halotolerans]
MSVLSEHIKSLRKQQGLTQEQLAAELGIKRSLLAAYEEGRAEPRLQNLLTISVFFGKSIDELLGRSSSTSTPKGSVGNSPKVLAITVDRQERENIELVPQKASAGYLNGFSDPEYIENLPKFQLPMLQNGTFRAFEIKGDSMLPLRPGTIVIGRYVEGAEQIKNSKTYILVTAQEGVVYKRVFNYLKENGKLFLVSDNTTYQPYQVTGEEILEIWEAVAYISLDFPDPQEKVEVDLPKLKSLINQLQEEITRIG